MKFEVGDIVWADKVRGFARVTAVKPSTGSVAIESLNGGRTAHTLDDRIELRPAPIAFEEVQAGDKIQTESVLGGIVTLRTGVANRLTTRLGFAAWDTEEDGTLVSTDADAVSIFLVNRPGKPVSGPKDYKAGTVYELTDPDASRSFVKIDINLWLRIEAGSQPTKWTDEDLRMLLNMTTSRIEIVRIGGKDD